MPAAVSADADARLQASRAAADAFQQDLKSELSAAMTQGGPTAAIEVCHVRAPQLAQAWSERLGAEVGRTALKLRNPHNAPAAWQREVLDGFAQRQAQGEGLQGMEYFAPTTDGGARYAQAIGTAAVCLTCHGQQIAPDVAARLAEFYPQDSATGFEAGSLRGALMIEWPAPSAAPEAVSP